MHGHHAACGALPAAGPYLRLSRFRSGQAICTGGAPPGSRPRFCSDRAPSYSSRPGSCPAAGIGRASAPSISGLVDSAGNRRNQLLDGSISLSPLYPSQASDLRQYRCGPPPEFPLAARSGIVHHLSGPGSMLTLEPFSEDQGRSAVHREDQPISFLTPYGFTHPLTRTHVRLLGPCFKAGRMGAHRRRHERADARARRGACCRTTIKAAASRGPLGGIYRPIGAAFPNNPTRRQRLRGATGSNAAGLSPSLAPLSRNLGPRVIRLTWGRVEDFGSSRAFGRSGGDLASEFTTACQGAPGILSSDFGQRRAVTRETSFRPISSRGLGAAICDTQAGVPSARRLEAQLAFKDFDGSRDSAIHTKYRISLDQPGSIHKSRQALVMFRKHMERGTGEDLAVIFCRRQACLAGQNFLSHRHNLSITRSQQTACSPWRTMHKLCKGVRITSAGLCVHDFPNEGDA
ncbi:hypothetical protein Bca4012_102565 [Brassica carinata]